MSKKVYFIHPVSTYNNPLEWDIHSLINTHANNSCLCPNRHAKSILTMSKDIKNIAFALVLTTPEGFIDKRTFHEIQHCLTFQIPVYEINKDQDRKWIVFEVEKLVIYDESDIHGYYGQVEGDGAEFKTYSSIANKHNVCDPDEEEEDDEEFDGRPRPTKKVAPAPMSFGKAKKIYRSGICVFDIDDKYLLII